MIWVFDSGMWWIISLKYLESYLPNENFMYLWDTEYLPYWDKSEDFIRKRTFACINWLFDNGCTLVIIACNTASAYAIRKRQKTNPDQKVLSVTIPGIEKIVSEWFSRPILLATNATIKSCIYPLVSKRLFPNKNLEYIVKDGWDLVLLIESQASISSIKSYLNTLSLGSIDWDCIVLWCTHYPLIQKEIEQILPNLPVINPSLESAKALRQYLSIHPEYSSTSQKKLSTSYFVTGTSTYWLWEELISITESTL